MSNAKDKRTSALAHQREGQMSDAVRLIGVLATDFALSLNRLAVEVPEFLDNVNEPVNDDVIWESHARSAIRAFFAYVEGTTYSLKGFAAVQLKLLGTPISNDELAAVYEIGSTINSKGEAVPQPMRTRLLENLLFMINLQSRAWKKSVNIDKNGKWWVALTEAMGVRDRLMHPKMADDIKVNFEDVTNTITAFEGYNKTLESVMGFKIGVTHLPLNSELIKEFDKRGL